MKTLYSPDRVGHFGTTSQRKGVTLTEVLMSLMIMSIGLSSVAVLFPISALRSAQATQLTNAAILKQNVATLVKMNPRLVFDPDGDFRRTIPQDPDRLNIHFQPDNRVYLVDPFGFYSLYGADHDGNGTVNATDDAFCNWFGNDGSAPVQVVRRFDGGLFAELRHPTTGVLPTPPVSNSLSQDQLRAFTILSNSVSRLGGSWTDQLDTVSPAGALITQTIGGQLVAVGVTLSPEDSLAGIPTQSTVVATDRFGNPVVTPMLNQVVIFTPDGRVSQSLPLTAIVGQKVYWSEYDDAGVWTDFNHNNRVDVNALNLPSADIGRVVIQSLRPNDFNWLLSVRRSGDGRAVVDVVIRHGSTLQLEDELIYPIQLTANGFFAGLRKGPGGQEPALRRGGYLFEPLRGRWYRINSYEEKPAVSSSTFWASYDYRLTLLNEAMETRGTDLDLDGLGDVSGSSPPNIDLGGAIFMPGIVDVYPLGTISLPELAELQ